LYHLAKNFVLHWPEVNGRPAIKVIQAGLVGKPLELHVWSNRPSWPQGIDRPHGEDPVPPTLVWDFGIGPVPMRPYKIEGASAGFTRAVALFEVE
jgi:hypothetical protein